MTMKIVFVIKAPLDFLDHDLEDFLQLLKTQRQVHEPNLTKIKLSKMLCMVYADDKPIGIGAIKQVYKTPFVMAKVPSLADKFSCELGYLYVENDSAYRGLGLGKTISRLLIKSLGSENIFATTEESDRNPMKHILISLGFKRTGEIYNGKTTGKTIGLYLLTR